MGNSQIEYKVLNLDASTSLLKADITDFLNPCNWDDSDCACYRLDGDVINIEIKGDDCLIFQADAVTVIDSGNGSDGSSGTSGGTGTGSGTDGSNSNSGSGSASNNNNSGTAGNNTNSNNNSSVGDNNDQAEPCLQLSNSDCAGMATSPITVINAPLINVDDATQEFFNNLQDDLKEFINDSNQNDLRKDIEDFLQDENYSDEAKDFVEKVLYYSYNNFDLDVNYDDKIINKLTGKAKQVYDKLTQQVAVNDILSDFVADDSLVDFTIQLDDTGVEVSYIDELPNGLSQIDYDRAKTSLPNENNHVNIYLNNIDGDDNSVDEQPELLVALTIIHEIVHVEFVKQLLEAVPSAYLPNTTPQDIIDALQDGDYDLIYDYYRRYGDWSHALMADKYRDTFARILQEYDTGTPVPASTNPNQLYMDLAWRGLMNNPAWGSLSATEKTRIINVITLYTQNN